MAKTYGPMRPAVAAVSVLACPLAWCPCALALNPALDVSQYTHTAWKIREGFSEGSIISTAQTPDGYLWVGTSFGLSRFDGVQNVPWQPAGSASPLQYHHEPGGGARRDSLGRHKEWAVKLEERQAYSVRGAGWIGDQCSS